MKHLFSLLVLISVCSQCNTREIVPPPFTGRLGEDITLSPQQAVILTSGDEQKTDSTNSITIRVTEAKEGRCPTGMQCIVAGYATASLLVTKGQTVRQSINLCVGGCPELGPYKTMDSSYFDLGTDPYVVYLKSIRSYAKSLGHPQKVQQLIIQVNQR